VKPGEVQHVFGPACYGRGGAQPTVSDATRVLGCFDPDFFLSGGMRLDMAAWPGRKNGRVGGSGQAKVLLNTRYMMLLHSDEILFDTRVAGA
jgi:hypothetical protein